MMNDKLLYATVHILCTKKIRFPYYLRTQHQQGLPGVTYSISCFSEAEVDFYRDICNRSDGYLVFISATLPDNQDYLYRQFLDGGLIPPLLEFSTSTPDKIRNQVDGKLFSESLDVRSKYDCEYF